VELNAPLFGDLALMIADRPAGGDTRDRGYPAARLQRGLLLICRGHDLAEEGVGFGVPVLKRGAQTVFAGAMELTLDREGAAGQVGADWQATATYRMNLVERLAVGSGRSPGAGGSRSRAFYAARDALAAVHRRVPALRGLLTAASNAVRRRFDLVTTFAETTTVAALEVTYDVHGAEGRVHVTVDLTGLPADDLNEVVVMNELGARSFDLYRDSDGARLRAARIGTWNRVAAVKASLESDSAGAAFSLGQTPGARLYRGWELVGTRLAWAGFGYAVQRGVRRFSYDVSFEPLDRDAGMREAGTQHAGIREAGAYDARRRDAGTRDAAHGTEAETTP
jgi:hypothetical protein